MQELIIMTVSVIVYFGFGLFFTKLEFKKKIVYKIISIIAIYTVFYGKKKQKGVV